MTTGKFWTLLGGTIISVVVCLLVLDLLIPQSDAVSQFIMISVGVFVLINIMAYYLGTGAAKSQNKYRFVHLMMILILVKMMICVALVLLYVNIGQPATRMFVIPFLMIYVIFTIFEIYVLQILAKLKPADVSDSET